MGLRVALEKVAMVLHIRSLDEDSLARMIYEEQKRKNWPGLVSETRRLCEILNIEDCNETKLSTHDYRKMFIEACQRHDEENQRKEAEGKTKCERILEDSYGQKDYFKNGNISEARQMFRTRVGLLPFAGNYKHSNKYKQTNWLCFCKQTKEDESHLKDGNCSVYKDIREKFGSLEDDNSLMMFFNEVLARRDALEEEDPEDGGGQDAAGALLAGGDSGEPLWGRNPSLA